MTKFWLVGFLPRGGAMFLKLEKLSDSSHRVWFISIPKVPWVLVLSIGLVFSFSPLSRIPFFLLLFLQPTDERTESRKKEKKLKFEGPLAKEREIDFEQEHQDRKIEPEIKFWVENGKSNYFSSPHTDGDEDGHG